MHVIFKNAYRLSFLVRDIEPAADFCYSRRPVL